MIPEKIHYCWFGGNPLPELAQKCIASWQKFLPDYEIIRWDESNYDVNKIPYIREAYAAKKYAFVSDYARFDILYHHGGLYFDTDVEIVKDMTNIIAEGSFMGCESREANNLINSGLGLGATQGLPVIKEILEDYHQRHFLKEDGSYDYTTIVDIVSEIFKKYGFESQEQKIQKIANTTIYPAEFFAPKNYITNKTSITPNTYSIHHYDGSWVPLKAKTSKFFSLFAMKLIGTEHTLRLKKLIKKVLSRFIK